jgi:nitroreductase
MQHFDRGRWQGGHWWHGTYAGRLGWWWIVGPDWYWHPTAIYPYPNAYIPPGQAAGFWYWCDAYQQYYPYVGDAPRGGERCRRSNFSRTLPESKMRDILDIIRSRHSSRMPFDPQRRVSDEDLRLILEAARWAPTAHNMQNFEAIVIDDEEMLAAISTIRAPPSETFIRENYAQLSFSEDELRQRKTGLLATMFPAAWRAPAQKLEEEVDAEHASLGGSMKNCPALLIIVYDTRKRAPASEGDVLGIMSLGCVMQTLWLMAEALGIGVQILSAVSGAQAEDHLHRLLGLPAPLKIAFACRLGYPAAAPCEYLRVRRDVREFVHHNRYGMRTFL